MFIDILPNATSGFSHNTAILDKDLLVKGNKYIFNVKVLGETEKCFVTFRYHDKDEHGNVWLVANVYDAHENTWGEMHFHGNDVTVTFPPAFVTATERQQSN